MENNRRTIDLTPQQNTLERLQGEGLYKKINLLVYWDSVPNGDFISSDDVLVFNWLSFVSQYNFKPISEFYIATIYCYLARKYSLDIPNQNELLLSNEDQSHDKNVRKERTKFLDKLNKEFTLEVGEDTISVTLKDGTDITKDVMEFGKTEHRAVHAFLDHRYVPKYLSKQLKEFLQSHTGLVVFLSNSTIEYKYPSIAFLLQSSTVKQHGVAKMADAVVTDESDVFNRTLALILEHNSLSVLRETLISAISSSEIKIIPTIQKESWIGYPLMKYLKEDIKKIVAIKLAEEPILCDPIDLEYQILFRLTSYEAQEIFENGSALRKIMEAHTNQINWQGLTTLSDDTVRKFKVNNVLVQKIFDEQKILVTKRMEESSLPLEKILNPEGIFAEEGWVISKNNDQYTLEHNEHDSVPITFKEVKREVAQAFHNDLHYIHTSRVWKAYGFFLPDEELPFSVLAIEPVDRTYKKNTLLLFGYDPRHCMEFTRLYSWPGVPKNVTSAIFGAMFSYLRKHEPRVEAAISAFMPTYASGLSMLTGGFEHPIMIKQGVHYFSPKNISGFSH
jgi:hypothetical protein